MAQRGAQGRPRAAQGRPGPAKGVERWSEFVERWSEFVEVWSKFCRSFVEEMVHLLIEARHQHANTCQFYRHNRAAAAEGRGRPVLSIPLACVGMLMACLDEQMHHLLAFNKTSTKLRQNFHDRHGAI